MKRRAGCFVAVIALALSLLPPVAAQFSTPPPDVTAENESWYSSGVPINLGGILYYPSGPVTHFNRNEMVFTGLFERIPIYKRTTQEPGSIVYIPLTGGLVRPYERRRSGDLAGTVGSTAPSFPVALRAAEPSQLAAGAASVTSSPAAIPRPVGTSGFLYGTVTQPLQLGSSSEATIPMPAGTTGVNRTNGSLLMPVVASGPARLETAQRPVGLNTVFLEFQNVRWYSAGRSVEFVAQQFTKVGEYRGFPVYKEDGRSDTIFVSPVPGEPAVVVPYKSR
jgi:hypothetical protein